MLKQTIISLNYTMDLQDLTVVDFHKKQTRTLHKTIIRKQCKIHVDSINNKAVFLMLMERKEEGELKKNTTPWRFQNKKSVFNEYILKVMSFGTDPDNLLVISLVSCCFTEYFDYILLINNYENIKYICCFCSLS